VNTGGRVGADDIARLTKAGSWRLAVAERLTHPSRLLSRSRPVWVTILVVSALLNFAVYLGHVRAFFSENDFRLYYAGAQVGLRYGWSHIYDVQLDQAAVAALRPAGPWYALLTPAPITWLVAPLTLIGYLGAYWVWVGLSLAALGATLWYARPRNHSAALYFIWWAALGPLWFSAYEGQVTILVAAALLAGWRLIETRRDFLGGAILALALFKPHLVLLLPLALLVAGRFRALLGFAMLAAAAGVGMLVTLHLDGIQGYVATLLVPKPGGDTAETLRSALGGGMAVLAIQAAAVIAVILIAAHARRARAAWPLVVSALLGSFLLAPYWHPQDYVVLDVAAAIMLAAAPLEAGVLVAAAMAIVSTPLSPLTNRQGSNEMILAWLLFAIVFLGFLGVRALMWRGPPTTGRQSSLPASIGSGARRRFQSQSLARDGGLSAEVERLKAG
jgi:alpha-1,2-mannosyltransferase